MKKAPSLGERTGEWVSIILFLIGAIWLFVYVVMPVVIFVVNGAFLDNKQTSIEQSDPHSEVWIWGQSPKEKRVIYKGSEVYRITCDSPITTKEI